MASDDSCPHDERNNFARSKYNGDGTEDTWTEQICNECGVVTATSSVKVIRVYGPRARRSGSNQNARKKKRK